MTNEQAAKILAADDPERIWLSPRCEDLATEGRTWSTEPRDCEDCELKAVEYVRADLASPTLWCCHVRGPDDVHAAPDYETALKWADVTNALNWRGRGGKIEPPASYDDCLLKAVPAIWPHSAEAHAENLPKSIRDFTPRNELPPDDPDYRKAPEQA